MQGSWKDKLNGEFELFFLIYLCIFDSPLQAQDWRLWTASQKGLHSPLWQRPLSTHVVLSLALTGGGQWLLLPGAQTGTSRKPHVSKVKTILLKVRLDSPSSAITHLCRRTCFCTLHWWLPGTAFLPFQTCSSDSTDCFGRWREKARKRMITSQRADKGAPKLSVQVWTNCDSGGHFQPFVWPSFLIWCARGSRI